MADWRQIQARIRKAKASPDAAAKLAELYEHTRDAMVAFELARWQEKAGEFAEAARWYTAAAERFRRSQWRTKAEAALARLRAPASSAGTAPVTLEQGEPSASAPPSESQTEELPSSASNSDASPLQGEAKTLSHLEGAPEDPADSQQVVLGGVGEGGSRTAQQPVPRGSRRRGRRGGRNRRGPGKRPAPSAGVARPPVQAENSRFEPPSEKSAAGPVVLAQSTPESQDATDAAGSSISSVAAWRARSRAGDPALASRMAQLESQLRRLLACPQAPLDQAESAPAGPGVLLLSDSDQVTHYYVESCQTLRIAIANLIRGGRGAKDMPRLKERLAENLGIAESRVGNYLKEHCAVRWLQLDEGASELAHFAIAVLRPAVNE